MMSRRWMAFGVVCLISGSGWLLDEWRAPLVGGLAGATLHLGVLAAIFGAWARRGSRRVQVQRMVSVRVGVWGAVLFGVPQIVTGAAGGRLSRFTGVLIFTLVPVMVVVAATQRRATFGSSESPLRLLAPALGGVAGAALLLPFHLPVSGDGWAWLFLALIAGCACAISVVRLHELLEGVRTAYAAACICLFAAVLAAPFAGVGWRPLASWSALDLFVEVTRLVLEVAMMLLLVWLLRVMPPAGFSAWYLLGPLATILEGYVLLRPAMSWALATGVLLLGGGGAWLLLADEEKTDVELGGAVGGR